jgi:hypothetical protein
MKEKKNIKVSKIRRQFSPSHKCTAYRLSSLVCSLLQENLFFSESIFPLPVALGAEQRKNTSRNRSKQKILLGWETRTKWCNVS